MAGLRDHILPTRCKHRSHVAELRTYAMIDSEIKNYKIDTMPGANLAKSIGPSAEFMQMPIAFNYRSVLSDVSFCKFSHMLDSNKTHMSSTPKKAR